VDLRDNEQTRLVNCVPSHCRPRRQRCRDDSAVGVPKQCAGKRFAFTRVYVYMWLCRSFGNAGILRARTYLEPVVAALGAGPLEVGLGA
jgi:hypothetical protein